MMAAVFVVVLAGVAVMAVRNLHREGHLPTRMQVRLWRLRLVVWFRYYSTGRKTTIIKGPGTVYFVDPAAPGGDGWVDVDYVEDGWQSDGWPNP